MSLLKNICKMHYNIIKKTPINSTLCYHISNQIGVCPEDPGTTAFVSWWSFERNCPQTFPLNFPNRLYLTKCFIRSKISHGKHIPSRAVPCQSNRFKTCWHRYVPHRIRAPFPSKRNHQSLASYMYSFQNVIYSIQSTKFPSGKYVGKPIHHCAPQHFQADTQWKAKTADGRKFLTMQPRSVWLLSLELQRHSTIHLQKMIFGCQIPNSTSFSKLQHNGDADFMSQFFYATVRALCICLCDTEIINLPFLLTSLAFS